jgi:uncharacterized membrane protein
MVGILFRWINLDKKVYWHDEVYTSLEITAHTRSELVKNEFVGKEVSVADLQKYQQMDLNRNVWQAIRFLGTEDNQHPPLFYVLTRYWVMLWGNSITTTRSIAVLFSLLVFPCLYGLCWQLFRSPLTGWVAIALMAVSPFNLLYAQEAREYSLWTVMVLLSGMLLLRAMKSSNWQSWSLYTLSLVISFYACLLSVMVAAWHGVYVLFNNQIYTLSITGFRLTRKTIAYLISMAIALTAFTPWFYFIFTNFTNLQASTGWTNLPQPLSTLANIWIYNFSRIFVDVGFDPFRNNNPLAYLLIVPVLLLEVCAVYFVCRKMPKEVWTFLLTLIASTTITFILPDLLLGGQRSSTARYMIPSFLGILIAVAYLLAEGISALNRTRRYLWQPLTGIIISAGIVSCLLILKADTWWHKVMSYHHPEIAQIINQSDRPLVISDAYAVNPGNIVSLSYLVDEKTTFFLMPEVSKELKIPTVSPSFTDIFFLDLPDFFREEFEQQYQSNIIPVVDTLWKSES